MSSGATFSLNAGSNDLEDGASWTNQADNSTGTVPGDGDIGIINANATTNGTDGTYVLTGVTINHTAGTLSGPAMNWNSPSLVYNLQGGTLSASGNFNANGGTIFNLSGGTLALSGNSDLLANSTVPSGYNLSGSATITVTNDFDLRLNSANTFFAIAPDWTGRLVSGNDTTEAQWIDELVYGAVAAGTGTSGTVPARQITVGGTPIDDENFSDFFQVNPDGSLSLQDDIVIPPSLALGSPFQDRMILQRDKPIKIWGTTDAGLPVNISIAGHSVDSTADANGDWEIDLPATAAGGGSQVLTVTSTGTQGSATRTINDVLFGDVWFCFGQSNMRWRFNNFDASWETFYTSAIPNNDNVRYLRTIEDGSLSEEGETQMTWLDNSGVNDWSAIASVFAYQLNQATGVPVAIVDSAWGSSSIEGWLPRELENDFPHYKEMLELYQSIGEYRSGVEVSSRVEDGDVPGSTNEEAISLLSGSGFSNGSQANIFMRTRPEIIYNERVHPLRRFGISGFIWYQGEANSNAALDVAQYQFTLPRMVEEYRERFGQGNLPFLGVQLPSHNESLWPWFRESQDSLLDVSNSYAAVTLDTGSSGAVHPSDKEEIGVRLSLLAREHALGENIESDSPRFASQSISGNQVTLTFDHANALTTTDGASPAGFEVAGSDGSFHSATASISGNTIIVSSAAEPSPVSVRYAWTPVTHTFVNTINTTPQPSGSPDFTETGLPLAPFRTDTLAIPGLTAQAPFGIDDSYNVPRDGVLTVPANGVLANDFDLNLDSLESTIVTTTSNGILDLQPDGSFTYTPDEGFAGSDSFTYRVEESAGALSSPPTTVLITVEGTSSSYYLWRQTIAWEPGDDQTASGDPDGDGSVNLLEYALGMNPLENDVTGLPTLTAGATGINFDFNNAQAGILYEVQTSTDLETWGDPAFASLDNTDPTPVVIPDSEGGSDRLFVRLRISVTD
ncbi:Ig-like domain-containing protein [bacterium]|nr:Ig-like domain-containing protein [bacterium]